MVDEKYWGRSAKGKRPLADGDVARLIAHRVVQSDQFDAELSAMDNIDPLGSGQHARGRLYVMAAPLSRPRLSVSGSLDHRRAIELVLATLEPRPQWATGFEILLHAIPHPDGLALATDSAEEWNADQEAFLAFLLLRNDGAVQFVSGDAVRTWGEEGPPCIDLPAVCETIQQVAAIAGRLGHESLGYAGQWRLGIRATCLRGLYPAQRFYRSGVARRFTPFQVDTYQRSAVVDAPQLTDPSSAVVESVATDLARGLGLANTFFPYRDISDLERKVSSTQ